MADRVPLIAWDYLLSRGLECRATFDSADGRHFMIAKCLWHATVFLPFILYLIGWANDANPRFPVTISWTVRTGVGRIVFHMCWVIGWLNFLQPLLRHRSACGANLFASLQMWGTGVVAISLSPVGISDAIDLRHYVTSGKYMVDHAIMMALFGVDGAFAKGFVASGVIFGVATSVQRP